MGLPNIEGQEQWVEGGQPGVVGVKYQQRCGDRPTLAGAWLAKYTSEDHGYKALRP